MRTSKKGVDQKRGRRKKDKKRAAGMLRQAKDFLQAYREKEGLKEAANKYCHIRYPYDIAEYVDVDNWPKDLFMGRIALSHETLLGFASRLFNTTKGKLELSFFDVHHWLIELFISRSVEVRDDTDEVWRIYEELRCIHYAQLRDLIGYTWAALYYRRTAICFLTAANAECYQRVVYLGLPPREHQRKESKLPAPSFVTNMRFADRDYGFFLETNMSLEMRNKCASIGEDTARRCRIKDFVCCCVTKCKGTSKNMSKTKRRYFVLWCRTRMSFIRLRAALYHLSHPEKRSVEKARRVMELSASALEFLLDDLKAHLVEFTTYYLVWTDYYLPQACTGSDEEEVFTISPEGWLDGSYKSRSGGARHRDFLPQCQVCESPTERRCLCRAAIYCSSDCQEAAWKDHCVECRAERRKPKKCVECSKEPPESPIECKVCEKIYCSTCFYDCSPDADDLPPPPTDNSAALLAALNA